MRAAIVTLACVTSALAAEWKPATIPALDPAPRWESVLRNQVRYLLATAPKTAGSGDQVRQLSETASSVAVCLRFKACEESAETRKRAVDILRLLTRDRTGWRRQWMSAFYAWNAALAGWLLWEDLPPDVRSTVDAMVIDEADRFLDLPAPYSMFVDTKGEENAWNSLILVFASEALPQRAHTARWRARALEYMVSALATPADRASGKARGANVQDDFTIENHGIVHPDYYLIGPAMSLPSAIVYRLLGKSAPQELSHNVREVYRTTKWFCLPGGDLLYPNGTDRTSHRMEMTATLHVFMERLFHDADAGALAADALDTLEKMQARNADGRTFAPGEFDHQKPAEGHAGMLYAMALIFAKAWKAPPDKPLDKVWHDLEGTRIFESGRFFISRTSQSVSSFAWGEHPMGLTIPFRKERLVHPVPMSYYGLAADIVGTERKPGRTAVGSAELAAAIQREPLTLQTVTTGEESGAVSATLGAIQAGRAHALAFTALPNGRSVYFERWSGALGGLISLLEEPGWVYGTSRKRIQTDGATWLNVDDQLGFVVSGGGGIRTAPDVRSLLVALNVSSNRDTTIVTLPGATAAATKELAARPIALKVNSRDVVAAVVDGFLIVSNLSMNPAVVEVEYLGRKRSLPINGFSTRVRQERGQN